MILAIKIFVLMFLLDFWRLIVRPRTAIQFVTSILFSPVILAVLLTSEDFQKAVCERAIKIAYETACFIGQSSNPPNKGITFWIFKKLRSLRVALDGYVTISVADIHIQCPCCGVVVLGKHLQDHVATHKDDTPSHWMAL